MSTRKHARAPSVDSLRKTLDFVDSRVSLWRPFYESLRNFSWDCYRDIMKLSMSRTDGDMPRQGRRHHYKEITNKFLDDKGWGECVWPSDSKDKHYGKLQYKNHQRKIKHALVQLLHASERHAHTYERKKSRGILQLDKKRRRLLKEQFPDRELSDDDSDTGDAAASQPPREAQNQIDAGDAAAPEVTNVSNANSENGHDGPNRSVLGPHTASNPGNAADRATAQSAAGNTPTGAVPPRRAGAPYSGQSLGAFCGHGIEYAACPQCSTRRGPAYAYAFTPMHPYGTDWLTALSDMYGPGVQMGSLSFSLPCSCPAHSQTSRSGPLTALDQGNPPTPRPNQSNALGTQASSQPPSYTSHGFINTDLGCLSPEEFRRRLGRIIHQSGFLVCSCLGPQRMMFINMSGEGACSPRHRN